MTQPIDARTYERSDGRFPGLAIDQLSIGEQLVIWAFRNRLAAGSGRALAQGFHVAFGLSMVEAALASFHGLYAAIRDHCRRHLGFHGPRCRCVSSDEIMIVSLIAASQAGMAAHAQAIGRCLIHQDGVDELLGGAGGLAMLLRQKQLRLPLRPLVCHDDGACGIEHPGRLH